jgi:hypothetical protein
MYPRWFNVAVVGLWLATMSWLVTTKVVPSLLVGEPPNYTTILSAQRADPPVGWMMDWDDRRLGWAVSMTAAIPQGLTEVRSRVHFDHLPLDEMVPDWLRPILPPFGERRLQVAMDSRSTLVFDPLGRLSRFESSVAFASQEPFVKVRGSVDGAKMALWIRVGDLAPVETEVAIPRNAMLGDTLSPQSRLPGLREGQMWTVESYGPLRPPNSPSEILCATVESRVPILWNGQVADAFLVVYRSDPGAAIGSAGSPRGKLWVRRDGVVLRQQVMVLRSTLTFVRLPERESARLAAALDSER